jgi:hypothetical protein
MPILYYKAHTNASEMAKAYYSDDNSNFVNGHPIDDTGSILNSSGVTLPKFYNIIKNPNFTVNDRPYRSESYILISAGADGKYGTADDVMNFEAE